MPWCTIQISPKGVHIREKGPLCKCVLYSGCVFVPVLYFMNNGCVLHTAYSDSLSLFLSLSPSLPPHRSLSLLPSFSSAKREKSSPSFMPQHQQACVGGDEVVLLVGRQWFPVYPRMFHNIPQHHAGQVHTHVSTGMCIHAFMNMYVCRLNF